MILSVVVILFWSNNIILYDQEDFSRSCGNTAATMQLYFPNVGIIIGKVIIYLIMVVETQ